MQLVGILIGQLLFGFMGDWIGRRTAMLTDMVLILLGVIMLTVANGTSEQVGSPSIRQSSRAHPQQPRRFGSCLRAVTSFGSWPSMRGSASSISCKLTTEQSFLPLSWLEVHQ